MSRSDTAEARTAIERLQSLGFDFAEADMIYHGEFLGPKLGVKVAALLSRAPTVSPKGELVSRLLGAAQDHVQPIDALRLHDQSPEMFPLSPEDVEGVLDLVDEAAAALTTLDEASDSFHRRMVAAEAQVVELRKALDAAEPYVETLHSLVGAKDARRQVYAVLKSIRTALQHRDTP